MTIFTIGFTQKSASDFFNLIKENKIDLLIDIRLNNVSQLAGFAKGKDLEYFLRVICNCDYVHDDHFAPTKELLDSYRAKKQSWQQYEVIFAEIMRERRLSERFEELYMKHENICLLCSEPSADRCHRRLVAEYLQKNIDNIKIVHI